MFRRKLIRALALAAATAAVAITGAALAGTAEAAEVDLDYVKMDATGFDFGSSDGDFEYGGADHNGELMWSYDGGQVSAHLTGALYLDGVVGDCARMRLDYFDHDGDTLATRYGGTVCAPDDQLHYWTVDLDPYSSPEIAELKVSVEKQTTLNGPFSTAVSSIHNPNINSHWVEIYATGFDFGNDVWYLDRPSSGGTVWWRLEEGGEITPHLTGTLWLNNVDGGCARMNIRYLSEAGSFLTNRPGGTVCVHDNDRHGFTVDLDPYGSNKIGQVNVQLQTQNANGTWNVVGNDIETIDCYC
jgi:hypothetical protein